MNYGNGIRVASHHRRHERQVHVVRRGDGSTVPADEPANEHVASEDGAPVGPSDYFALGYSAIPLRAGTKSPPPPGITGYRGRYTTTADLERRDWTGNVALRLSPDVVGVDVDVYNGGNGGLAELEEQFGKLPPTTWSTSRNDGSGIRLFRVPTGTTLRTNPAPGIDMVQYFHRYTMCSPSIHPDTRQRYRWIDELANEPVNLPPEPGELPELPWTWIEGLTAPKDAASPAATPHECAEFVDTHTEARRPAALKVVQAKLDAFKPGHATCGRHDTLLTVACWAMREAAAGYYSAAAAVKVLDEWWRSVMDDPSRRDGGEFGGAIAYAIGQADGDSERIEAIRQKPEVPPDTLTDNDVEALDPDRFFDSKTGLLHASLRTAILAEGPIATGTDGNLWWYSNGVWKPHGDDEVRRRGRRLLDERMRKSHVEGVVADLSSDHPLITDSQPTQWLNCRNGLLDWRTGVLHPHNPEVGSTYQLAVNWNPNARCPAVDQWLTEVAPEDAIGLIWQVIGTATYPDQPFHRAVLLLGPGRNGKGTLLRLVAKVIGHEHIAAVTLQALGESRFSAAQLFGKVANIAGDLDARSINRTDLFKMATGGDCLTGEHKYGALFTFTNRATMLFSANEPPGSADHTDGFFSRWVVIPFTRLQLAPGDENPAIEQAMHQELEGVLVAAVGGLRQAMTNGGYDTPRSALEATDAYREAADPLRRFVNDCLDITGSYGDTETRSQVYCRYKYWNEENGHRPLGANRFWARLRAIDPRIDPDRFSGGSRLVGGIQLGDKWQ